MARLKSWRYGLFVGGILGAIALTMYPIAIYPMMHVDEYKAIQQQTRKGVKQEDIQPGNMKVWSDPFAKKE